jgi:hypothetical protein
MKAVAKRNVLTKAVLSLGLVCIAASTGCQVDVGGQVLPSPYYFDQDIAYFPKGPEMKLQREASAMKQYRDEQNAADER